MSNSAFTFLDRSAVFQYEYRNTAGSWSTAEPMFDGVTEHERGFVVPVACDELRITGTYSESSTFNRCPFANLSIITGLDFSISAGVGSLSPVGSAVPQSVDTLPKLTQNQLIRFADTLADQVQVTITGIGQQRLNFDQMGFGYVDLSPVQNFDSGGSLSPGSVYNLLRSLSVNYASIDDSSRALSLQYSRLSDVEYKTLVYLANYKASGAMCFFEFDASSDQIEDAYFALVIPEKIDLIQKDNNIAQVKIIEVYPA